MQNQQGRHLQNTKENPPKYSCPWGWGMSLFPAPAAQEVLDTPEPVATPGSSSQQRQSSTEDHTVSKDTRANVQTYLTSDRTPPLILGS